jgi:hypothetical protein
MTIFRNAFLARHARQGPSQPCQGLAVFRCDAARAKIGSIAVLNAQLVSQSRPSESRVLPCFSFLMQGLMLHASLGRKMLVCSGNRHSLRKHARDTDANWPMQTTRCSLDVEEFLPHSSLAGQVL